MACKFTYTNPRTGETNTYTEKDFSLLRDEIHMENRVQEKELIAGREITYENESDVEKYVGRIARGYDMTPSSYINGNISVDDINARFKVYNLDSYGVHAEVNRIGNIEFYIGNKRYKHSTPKDYTEAGVKYQRIDEDTEYTVNTRIAIDVLDRVTNRLSKVYGVKYQILSGVDMYNRFGKVLKGAYDSVNGIVYLNKDLAGIDTAMHEYGHIFLEVIKQKNAKLYQSLLSSVEDTPTAKRIRKAYPVTKKFTIEQQNDETIVEMLGVQASLSQEQRQQSTIGKAFDDFIAFILRALRSLGVGERVANISEEATLADVAAMMGSDSLMIKEIRGDRVKEQKQTSPVQKDSLDTENKQDFYTSASAIGKKWTRFSNIIVNMGELGVYDRAILRADNDFRTRNLDKKVDKLVEDDIEYTYDEHLAIIKNDIEKKLQYGRAFHMYMDYLMHDKRGNTEEAEKTLEEFNSENMFRDNNGNISLLLDFENTDKDKGPLLKEKITNFFEENVLKIVGSAVEDVLTEMTIGIDMPSFKVQTRDGELEMVGIAGTSDVMVYHGDNRFSLYDYKTGELGARTINKNTFKHGSAEGFNYSSMNTAILKLALDAMSVRYKNRDMKLEDIGFIKYSSINNSNGFISLGRQPGSQDLANAFETLEKYFKKEHNAFYNANKDLFDMKTYYPEKTREKVEMERKYNEKGLTTTNQIWVATMNKYLLDLQSFSESKAYMSSKGEELDKEDRDVYFDLLSKIGEHIMGEKLFMGKLANRMNIMEATLSNFYDKESPVIQLLQKIHSTAMQSYSKELQRAYDRHDAHVGFLAKRMSRDLLQVGAKYKEDYAFMWTKHENGWYATTYNDAKWSKLSNDEKKYANHWRWEMRFALFSTLNPAEGVEFIEKELKERGDLTESDRKVLNEQIKELKGLLQINKFKSSGIHGFNYFEGWVPRVHKSMEESKFFKERIRQEIGSSIMMNESDLVAISRDQESRYYSGLSVKYFGRKDADYNNHGDEYTWNTESIFKAFAENMYRKKNMDFAYNYFLGIKEYLRNLDTIKGTDMYKNIEAFIINQIKATIEIQRIDNFKGMSIPKKRLKKNLKGDETEEEKYEIANYSFDKMLLFNKVYWGITLQALNLVGGIRTSLTQIIRTINKGIGGSFASALGSIAGVKKVDYKALDVFKSVGVVFSMLGDMIRGKEKSNKLYLMIREFTYLVTTYDFNMRNPNKLETYVSFFLPKWLTANNMYFTYRIGDTFAYSAVLYPMLKNMKIEKDGKLISMYDAYEVEDGKLVYKGPDRGVDSVTGETIKGLTVDEIVTLKNVSRKLTGNMRDDEKVGAHMSTIGAIGMQFKQFGYATVENAWHKEFINRSLGAYLATEEYEIIDPEHKDYGKRFAAFTKNDKGVLTETEEYKRLKEERINGQVVKMLPVMKFTAVKDQGYMSATLNLLRANMLARMITGNPKKFKEEWAKMSDNQKQSVFFAMSQFLTYFIMVGIIAMIFGDSDDEDKNNVWKMQLVNLADDTIFETIFIDPVDVFNTAISLPSLNAVFELAGNTTLLTRSMITGNYIKSGPNKGLPKKLMQVSKGIIGVRTAITNYDFITSWDEFMEKIEDMSIENYHE